MKRSFIICLCYLLITNCDNTPETNNVVIIDKKKVVSIAESVLLNRLEITQLGTSENTVLGEFLELYIADNEFYVADYRSQRNVLQFDSTGRFKNKLFKHGMGPEELRGFSGWWFDKQKEEFLVLSSGPTIFRYTCDGDFRGKFKVPIPGVFAYAMDGLNNKYYYTSLNGLYTDRLHVYNPENKHVRHLLPFKSELPPVSRNVFSSSGDSILLAENFFMIARKLFDRKIIHEYKVNIKGYSLPETILEMEMMEFMEYLEENPLYSIMKYLESDKYLVLDILCQDPDEPFKYIFIRQKKTGREEILLASFKNTKVEDVFFDVQMLINDNELVFLLQPSLVAQNPEAKDFFYKQGWETHSEDNPIVLKMNLK